MSDIQKLEEVVGRLRSMMLQLDGSPGKPGIIQLLDGDGRQQGLIAQTYHTGELLAELLKQRATAADLFEPGEAQDKKIEQVRQRLGAILSEEARRISAPLIETIQTASLEVLNSLKRTREESHEILGVLAEQREAEDQRMEALSVRLEEVFERIYEVGEHLDKIATIDTARLSDEVREASDDAFRQGMAKFREQDKKWLSDLIQQSDGKVVQRLSDAIEGQNIVFEEQFLRGRSDLAKAIEGTTYGDVLTRLQKQLSDKETEIRTLRANARADAGQVSEPKVPASTGAVKGRIALAIAVIIGAGIGVSSQVLTALALS